MVRSFGAELIKNAALANKIAVAPALPVAARPVPRPEQAPKITTSSNENSKPSEGAIGSSNSAQKKSKKKVVCTLTTALTARSKTACGLKQKELIEDIDKLDGNNQLAMVDYVDDIYMFYNASEHESRPSDYMGKQPEVNPKMRAILTDWMVGAHGIFQLMPETLYLTIYIVDRYLSLQPVLKRELQLVGIVAMLIACKYEEIWTPEVNDFMSISNDAFSRQQILVMEKAVLNNMEWNLTLPTPHHFLVRFTKAEGSGDKQLEHMIHFFGELAMMDYRMATIRPSMVAASAVYAARCTLRKSPLWTDTLKHHTGLHEQQLMEGAKILISSHAAAPVAKLNSIYRKYASEQFGCVALHPPAEQQPIEGGKILVSSYAAAVYGKLKIIYQSSYSIWNTVVTSRIRWLFESTKV
uniref:Cyc1 n=1 Tax=Arundo donax TaxID=35708 RepID=A0A0A9H6V0_ARUDO